MLARILRLLLRRDDFIQTVLALAFIVLGTVVELFG